MSLGKPSVMSPVGVNPEIIEHGVNGYLCNTTEEWVDCLSALIESEALRKQIGDAGRLTIDERYSVKSAQGRLLQMLDELM